MLINSTSIDMDYGLLPSVVLSPIGLTLSHDDEDYAMT